MKMLRWKMLRGERFDVVHLRVMCYARVGLLDFYISLMSFYISNFYRSLFDLGYSTAFKMSIHRLQFVLSGLLLCFFYPVQWSRV